MKKLLVLLCVIALLGALCVPAMATTSRVPVVAQVPDDWTTPYLYAWGDSEEVAWPGVPMTQIEDWYVAYMNDSNYKIIINNGSNAQTPDLDVDQGLPVCVMAIDPTKADVGPELPIEVPAEDKMPKPAADTITAKVPDDWSTAFLYAWASDGAVTNGAWPGVAMTKGDDGLWVGELAKDRYTSIIVTCSDAGPQTVDLAYGGGDAWVALQGDNGGKLDAAVVYSEPADWDNVVGEKPPVPVFEDWYVAGTMNNWNCADPEYKMTANGDGSFTYSMNLDAGSYQLKVTNGTWDVCYGQDGGPEGNYGFSVNPSGEVTVNYDGNGVVTVEGDVVGPYEESAPITTPDAGATITGDTWYLCGSMNEWALAADAYKMTAAADGSFVAYFNANPGDYELKVNNGTWDVNYGVNGLNGDNYTFNVADATSCVITLGKDGSISHAFMSEDAAKQMIADLQKSDAVTDPTEPAGNGDNQGTTGTDVPNPDKSADKGEGKGGSAVMLISIIATVVVLAGGGVAVFFILKKDKKEEK